MIKADSAKAYSDCEDEDEAEKLLEQHKSKAQIIFAHGPAGTGKTAAIKSMKMRPLVSSVADERVQRSAGSLCESIAWQSTPSPDAAKPS